MSDNKLPASGKITQPPEHIGHRSRLKTRFAESGASGLADYELLELLLFRSIPRRDTKPIAKQLLKEFGSIADTLNASDRQLKSIKGVGDSTIVDFKLIRATAQLFLKGNIQNRPLLASMSSVIEYCTASMAYETREQLRILFLDKKNKLIKEEVQQTGTVDHTPVYPREVISRAFELSATALILVHNHPSGDPTPSEADIEMTKRIDKIAAPLGIKVHDHIIIGKDGYATLKGLGLF